jgi:ribosome-associated protein
MILRVFATVLLLALFSAQISLSSAFTFQGNAVTRPATTDSLPRIPALFSVSSDNVDSSNTILCDLQTFLRLIDVVPTGGAAKVVIQGGQCMLNDDIETRRAKKLYSGDIVSFGGNDYDVDDHVALCGYVYKPKRKKAKRKKPNDGSTARNE